MDHIIYCLLVLGATVMITHACPKYCVCQNLSESLGHCVLLKDFFSCLQILTAAQNTISYIQPFSFGDLETLRSLHLDNNRLMELGPDDLRGLVNLQHLIVNNNQLGRIHDKAFEDLAPALEDLDLSYNNLMSLPWDSVRHLHGPGKAGKTGLTSNRLQKLPPDPHLCPRPRLRSWWKPSALRRSLCVTHLSLPSTTHRMLVLEGQTASLRCEATGDPSPTIHWISPDDRLLGNSSRTAVYNNGTLSITITTSKDYGTFTCIAANVAGESTAPVEVSIVQLPHLSNGTGQPAQPKSRLSDITGTTRISKGAPKSQPERAVSVSEVTSVSALVKWTVSKSAPKVKMYQLHLSQLSLGEKQATHCTDRQSIAGPTYTDKRPLTLTFTPTTNLESPINLDVFGLWKEAGENPCRHKENMKTPHRKAPGLNRGSNPEPSCCEATVLTTAPLCRPAEFQPKLEI
uniref:Leucine rich repeat and fibronectin type III domain containing 2 n=1 Tax=Lates calcarifer TaxID=8187 RepID=A0A4W6F1S1_LATCA